MKIIIGLGNPDEQYEKTRHNIGRDIVSQFAKKNKFPEFEFDKKSNSLISEGKLGKQKVFLVLPNTYMNKSGDGVSKFVKSKKQALETLVIYDDLDLGIGTLKISFNKGSGGHKGLESVIKKIKTKEFPRIRVGISSVTSSGKVKKPSGEDAVIKHVLGKFKPSEETEIKKVMKKAAEGIEIFIEKDHSVASNQIN
jgi:peptidyl-tRNA hydrolase, PTH1 family